MEQSLSQSEKKLLRRLHEKDHFIESITNNTPDIIYVLELRSGVFSFLNSRVKDIMGNDNLLLDKVHPDDANARAKHITDCIYLSSNETKDIKIRMKVKSGAWHWFHIRDLAYKSDMAGLVTHIIGVARDIHKDKEHEEILYGILKTQSLGLAVYKAIRRTDNQIEDFEFILTSKKFDEFHNRTDLIGKRVLEEYPMLKTQMNKWIKVIETGDMQVSKEQYPDPKTGKLHHFIVKFEKFNDGIMVVWDDVSQANNVR